MVPYKRADMQPYGDMDVVTFQRLNRWKTATLDWRGYNVADAYSKKEDLMNRGQEAIIKLVKDMANNLKEDITEQFAEELYVDGNAAGNESRIHGLESFMGASYTTGLTFTNSDTYAGLQTALGAYGGSWSGTWPFGTGDIEYDFWTPLILNYRATGWDAATDNWANNALQVLRYAIAGTRRNAGKQGMIDVAMLDRSMYVDWLNALDDKERIVVERDKKSSLLVELGFADTVMYDGVEITSEYGLPSSASSNDARIGYGLNTDAMELCSLQGQLFVPDGPTYDISQKSTKMSIDFFGNMKVKSPRHFFKLLAD